MNLRQRQASRARTTGSQRADPIRSHRRRTFDGYKIILTNTPSDGRKLNGLPSLGCDQLFAISACVELPFPRPGPGRSEKSLAVRPIIHPGGSALGSCSLVLWISRIPEAVPGCKV